MRVWEFEDVGGWGAEAGQQSGMNISAMFFIRPPNRNLSKEQYQNNKKISNINSRYRGTRGHHSQDRIVGYQDDISDNRFGWLAFHMDNNLFIQDCLVGG